MKPAIDLLTACIKQERKAQFDLYKLCYDPLLNICFRYKNNREDAVALLNGAFYKVLTQLEKKNEDAPFEFWAKRVTINHCLSVLRSEKKDKLLQFTDDESDLEYYAENELDFELDEAELSQERIEEMRKALNELPETAHEVFQLHVFEGYTHQEIGQILDISKGTSKWHLHEARKKLQKALSLLRQNLLSIIA